MEKMGSQNVASARVAHNAHALVQYKHLPIEEGSTCVVLQYGCWYLRCLVSIVRVILYSSRSNKHE